MLGIARVNIADKVAGATSFQATVTTVFNFPSPPLYTRYGLIRLPHQINECISRGGEALEALLDEEPNRSSSNKNFSIATPWMLLRSWLESSEISMENLTKPLLPYSQTRS